MNNKRKMKEKKKRKINLEGITHAQGINSSQLPV
jgi:hypothetical protein